MADDAREKLAEARTDMAEDRTILANERTFAGWLRTGLAAVGIGLGFNALFQRIEPAWVPKAIATIILAIGIFIFVSAERRACSVIERLETHAVKTARKMNLRLIAGGMVIAAMALIAAIWTLES